MFSKAGATTGNQVSVDASLSTPTAAPTCWAEQFDTPRADLLQTQDEIVMRLGHAMFLQLIEVEAARVERAPAANPGAEDLSLQCEAAFLKTVATPRTQKRVSVCANRRSPMTQQCRRPDVVVPQVLAFARPRLLAFARPRHRPKGRPKHADELLSKALASIQTTAPLTSSRLSYSSSSFVWTRRSRRTNARST